jgi:hypothetical protein
MTTFTAQVQYDNDEGVYYIPFPDEMLPYLDALGWKPNDDLQWIDNKDGSFTIKKKDTDNE